MGKVRKTRKFAQKRMISLKDTRLHKGKKQKPKQVVKKDDGRMKINTNIKSSSAMFHKYNQQLGPPYNILLDTNFINHSIQNKLDLIKSSMDLLMAKCNIYVTDCVMSELEKAGKMLALKIVKDPLITRLHCDQGCSYADDCLVKRVQKHKCYMVATHDRDLKRRIRKVDGVPIIYISNRQYQVERMPDALGSSF